MENPRQQMIADRIQKKSWVSLGLCLDVNLWDISRYFVAASYRGFRPSGAWVLVDLHVSTQMPRCRGFGHARFFAFKTWELDTGLVQPNLYGLKLIHTDPNPSHQTAFSNFIRHSALLTMSGAVANSTYRYRERAYQ